MLPEAAITYFGQMCSREFATASIELHREAKEFQLDANRRGVKVGSGAFDTRIATIYTGSLAKSMRIVMQCVEKTHANFGSAADEATKVKLIAIGTDALASQYRGLEEAYLRYFERFGTVAKFSSGLSLKHQLLEAILANSIGEYFWQLRNVPMKSQQVSAGMQIVNYGSIGAVQTGAGSKATVQQQVSGGDSSSLIDALEKLGAVLAAEKGVAAEVRAMLQDLIGNATVELKKADPDKAQLADWLNLLASTVQAIASAQLVYDVVRSAAETFGISL